MKKINRHTFLKFGAGVAICFLAYSFLSHNTSGALFQDQIIVNVGQYVIDTSRKPIGINTNYLLDDDANRPSTNTRTTTEALKDMGVTYLRYPGGDKSDSYLWSTPPFASAAPALARTGPNEWPSGDKNLVNDDYTTYKINPLDFDEFMTMAHSLGATPNLVVDFDSQFKPADLGYKAPTTQELLTTATEWVRYANITKGYGVKYWEIGNESYLGSHNGKPTLQQYIDGVIAFSRAMKAVDPTIKIGANGGGSNWWPELIKQAGNDIDFLIAHEYPPYQWGSYEYYRTNNVKLNDEVHKVMAAIDTYASPEAKQRLEIAVTETNSADWSDGGWPNVNDLGHAIVLFDIFGQHLKEKRVSFTELWNTRWIKNNDVNPSGGPTPELWDALNKENNFNATGTAMKIWGQNLLEKMLLTTDTTAVKSYASFSPNTGKLTIFLINKETQARSTQVNLQNYLANGTGTRFTFRGTSPTDIQPVYVQDSDVSVDTNNAVSLTLDPVSITMLTFNGSQQLTNVITNPSFENDISGWQNWGNGSVVNADMVSGSSAQQVGMGDGGLAQQLYFEPNTTYLCESWAKLGSAGEQGWIGFKTVNTAGVEVKYENKVTSTSYTKFNKTFTTPTDLKEVWAYTWHSAGASYLYADDFKCIPESASPSLTPSPTITPAPTVAPTTIPTLTLTKIPTPTKTPTPVTISITPVADAYVNGSSKTTNYGSSTNISSVGGSSAKTIFFRFNLAVIPAGKTIVSATLKMYVTNGSTNTQTLSAVSDTVWGEKTITVNNKPSLGSLVTTFVPGGSSNVTNSVPITAYVATKNGQLLSIAISSTGTDTYTVSSKETSTTSRRPVLVIQYR